MLSWRAWSLALGVCAVAASAQNSQPEPPPKFEAGLSYTYNAYGVSANSQVNQSGGSISGEYFFRWAHPRMGGRSEFGVSAEFARSGSGGGSLNTYLFGPRWGIQWRHVRWYGGITGGGARVRVNGFDSAGFPVSLARSTPAVSFAQVGVDLLFGTRYVVNLLQADDLAFEAPDPSTGRSHWRGGIRVSGGFAFRFGQRKP